MYYIPSRGEHWMQGFDTNWYFEADGKRSAQFEQTLLVTENGCEVLTARQSGQPWFKEQLLKQEQH